MKGKKQERVEWADIEKKGYDAVKEAGLISKVPGGTEIGETLMKVQAFANPELIREFMEYKTDP